MITFGLLATALIAGVLVFVLLPLLRHRPAPANISTDRGNINRVSINRVNINIYRDQLRELDDDLAAGTISHERHAEARSELERRLLEDTADDGEDKAAAVPHAGNEAAVTPRAGKLTTVMLAATIPLAAIGLYLIVGTPESLAPQPAADSNAAHGITPQQVEMMIDKLAAKLKSSPDDGEGWVMLGRSYAVLERFSEAAAAYAQAAARIPGDAQLLVDYADILAMSQGWRLSGEPQKLVERALAIDPNNPKALALAGTAAFENKQYAIAVKHWQKLIHVLPADSEIANTVQGSITEAQALAGAATPGTLKQTESAKAAAPAARVGGSIQIAGTLKAKAAPDATVFIFARAADGPPAPLAVLRKRVADLPMKFELDDSMAMAPGMNLSRFGNVIIGARISKSGTATRQPGDFEGFSKTIQVGATDVVVVIDTEVR